MCSLRRRKMRKSLSLILILLLVIAVAGCATTRKKTPKSPVEELQAKVTDIETKQVEQTQQISGLKDDLAAAQQAKATVTTSPASSSKSVEKTKENIQKALKAAGYYDGEIDGKIGQKTKKAIIAFQEASGLTADGVVGKRTWSKLKQFLY